jgi:hypothetical protein
MTAQELTLQIEQRDDEAAALTKLWLQMIGTHAPALVQFHRWLSAFGFDSTHRAVQRTSQKYRKLQGNMDGEFLGKYCTSCAKNHAEENQQAAVHNNEHL